MATDSGVGRLHMADRLALRVPEAARGLLEAVCHGELVGEGAGAGTGLRRLEQGVSRMLFGSVARGCSPMGAAPGHRRRAEIGTVGSY